MVKRLAVIVRNRVDEALRMSLGLTLMDDEIDVYLLDVELQDGGTAAEHLELLKELDVKVFSNRQDDTSLEFVATAAMAGKLPAYDHVLCYR
ncbi:MAG: hypothetical protein QF797_00180 [Alphaproteobacteria bacterium]|mgnify:CR=1 FL=1|jgi:hypothetical protein|nr:hypothetical protein [Rhodospirillaceae bacterium]MDP6403601.1 hypothetical protein [Alphaproteobacteria bacterium]MDP6622551.1 hypothetical protein [Alphaproteobacteria bacterium]|tara:strand:- start:2179 stop:2454 length:276 start_codon:yes stop_codon:yes gene_type:complete